jgi:hypothetical protein
LPRRSSAKTAGASPAARSARLAACCLLLALLLTSGCVSLGSYLSPGGPPKGAVCQVVATWNSKVVTADDPVHGGTPTPGLAGRVYLFGPQIDFPLVGDGGLVVDLYDQTNGKPVMLEEWRFDAATLGRLLRKDMIGWGYTVFLPWGTYRPDILRVRLKVRYEPPGGAAPIYAESSPITLNAVRDFEMSSKSAPASPAGPEVQQAGAFAAARRSD